MRWGPYLSERGWGTVREDYSAGGTAWDYFPHDHARSRVYRWNEDGLAGISDAEQLLCFAIALWNGRDPILKERLFGLTGPQGNHGEDVKEYYFFLDSTPTHSYMRMLYKYPQAAFPYGRLLEDNARRGRGDLEFELIDTGVFDGDRYFDVVIEYAKAAPDDLLICLSATNRGPEPAILHLLPTLWFRNTWAWGLDGRRPALSGRQLPGTGQPAIRTTHSALGDYELTWDGDDPWFFTDNETNAARLWGVPGATPYVKDAFHEALVHGNRAAVNPEPTGTKAAVHCRRPIDPGGTATVRLRLARVPSPEAAGPAPFSDFDATVALRRQESAEFYAALEPRGLTEDERRVQRQALAGLLWSKQFYCYDVDRWLTGDPGQPPPPPERAGGRNRSWRHLDSADIISVPDTWEYPWFAAWDLAFHAVALAPVDAAFAKDQLRLLWRDRYQHPSGQVPAYEWAFGDVNPPVLAWASWRVYEIDRRLSGRADLPFLESAFLKMMLYFTWWVNRKDAAGSNIFEGGFLGLDNIGVFDRSAPLPTGGYIEQSDGTSWMSMYCLNMMTVALELARSNPVYESIATKFFEHFLYIAAAMNNVGGLALWDDGDEFFYDVLHLAGATRIPMKLRSLVGLIPLFAVETIEPEVLEALPRFRQSLEWFLEHRPGLAQLVSRWHEPGVGDRRLVALVRGHRMKCLLRRMLDPAEFLADHGVRSISRAHEASPYVLRAGGHEYTVRYEPAESRTGVFGGNSNWRGPIWFPVNYLLIESLQKFHHYYGDDFTVECPTGSGQHLTLDQVADELSQRLIRLFLRDRDGRRPVFGGQATFQGDPHWRDHLLFYEYFHGDSGAGLGASHQTGWTALVAKLIQQQGERRS
jgi:hypothetical protein